MVQIIIKVIAVDLEEAQSAIQDLLDQSDEYQHMEKTNAAGVYEAMEVTETKPVKEVKTKK